MQDSQGKKDLFLKEAIRIGEWLLTQTESDQFGEYWKTMSMDLERNISFIKSENIYTGVSGIVLFFLELFKQTQDARFKKAAQNGINWVVNYCHQNPPTSFAFFTGRMGVSYSLLQMYRYFGEKEYLDKALAFAKPCLSGLESDTRVDDLINGISGTILGLLHLHSASGDEWILHGLDKYVSRLLQRANLGPAGLYWDRSAFSISGLCGFSHGAAGIGYVFLELGQYFQKDAFFRIAEQAFLYERFRFFQHKKVNNWPDLRKGIYSDEDFAIHKEAYISGNMEFFVTANEMNAWCHGAAGIGLSRLQGYQILGNPLYLEDTRIAIEKTIATDIAPLENERTHILCHGTGGNAELFLKAYSVLKDESYLEYAEQIATNILEAKKKYNRYQPGFHSSNASEDTSLFMGNAGIGYFMLRLFNPQEVPSILAPSLEQKNTSPIDGEIKDSLLTILITPDQLLKQLISKYFSRTLLVCEHILPEPLSSFYRNFTFESSDTKFSVNDSFIAFVQNQLSGLSDEKKEILRDIFNLELEIITMEKEVTSNSVFEIKNRLIVPEAERIIAEGKEKLKQRELILDSHCHLTYTLWNWCTSNKYNWHNNPEMEPGEDVFPVMLKPTAFGIREFELTPFSYTVLGAFAEGSSVVQAIQITLEAFEALSQEEEEELTNQILEQIEQGITAGVLCEKLA